MKKITDLSLNLQILSNPARDVFKLIAAILMALDHMAYAGLVHPDFHNCLGRGVYPIFAYALACFLVLNPLSIQRYTKKMFIYAVLTQPIYYLFIGNSPSGYMMMNVFITLLASALVGFYALSKGTPPVIKHGILLVLIIFGNIAIPIEYHLAGIALPIAFAMVLRKERLGIMYLIFAFLMLNAPSIELDNILWYASTLLKAFYASSVFAIVYIFSSFIAKDFKIKNRFLPSHFLYVFYPFHIALIILWKLL